MLLLAQNVVHLYLKIDASGTKADQNVWFPMDPHLKIWMIHVVAWGMQRVHMYMFMSCLKKDRTWFVNDISMGWCHDWSCLTSNSYIYIYCTVLVTYTHLPFWRHSFKMESHLPNSFPAGITEVWPLAYLILSPHFCKYFTPGNKHRLITN